MENSLNNDKQSRIVSTPKEVANYLGKSISWVYKYQNELGVKKLKGSLFFPPMEELYERLFCEEKRLEVRFHAKGNQAHRSMVHTKTGRTKGRSRTKRRTAKTANFDTIPTDPNRHGLLGAGE